MNHRGLTAPSLSDIEALAHDAYARLPAEFRRLCGDVLLKVEDFPTDDVVEEMELESPFDILGLYTGAPLTQRSLTAPPLMPDVVFLYRRPILDYWAEHEETLGDLVTHVLVHEIGHHFGLSDADMEAIEASAG